MQIAGYSIVSGELISGIRISKKIQRKEAPCPLLALSGHFILHRECPLSGALGILGSSSVN
jgi:hypothetical protein